METLCVDMIYTSKKYLASDLLSDSDIWPFCIQKEKNLLKVFMNLSDLDLSNLIFICEKLEAQTLELTPGFEEEQDRCFSIHSY